MEEIWKDLPDFQGIYQASTKGRIRMLDHYTTHLRENGTMYRRKCRAMIRKLQRNYDGKYLAVGLKHHSYTVHRLIAKTFLPNPKNLEFVNHKDGNKHNNNVENLEWCTRQENETHAFATGLKNSTGEHNTMAKLTDKQAKYIKFQEDRSYDNKLALCAVFNVHRATIERIWNNKIWKHVA